jgi:hypothetical protein
MPDAAEGDDFGVTLKWSTAARSQNEQYPRTAVQDSSLRRMTGLIG